MRTFSKNVDGVTRRGKSMGFGYFVRPFFNLVGFNLNGLSALAADQVMVVAGATGSVEQFTIFTLQAIGF